LVLDQGCENERMLVSHTVLDYAGIEVAEVACRHRSGRGAETEPSSGYGLVFVRRGCFVRHADGAREVLDPTVAFARAPGQEQHYDHPTDAGDDCTALTFDEPTAAALWGAAPPERPLTVSARLDFAHRQLLAEGRRGADPDALYEHAVNLAAATLSQSEPEPLHAARPSSRRARRRLVHDTREALAEAPARALPALARELGVSPHHLSRVFHAHTGHTIAQHRLQLRGRAALERIANGEDSLARLAAELGFADQSHLTRTIRQQTGHTPTQLRTLIHSGSPAPGS
jgi:AraC-like DNA-binding protein